MPIRPRPVQLELFKGPERIVPSVTLSVGKKSGGLWLKNRGMDSLSGARSWQAHLNFCYRLYNR